MDMDMTIFLPFILTAHLNCVFSHIHVRYQSTPNYRVNEATTLSMTKYLDSIGGCASWCTAIGDQCEAFSSKYISTDRSVDEVGYMCEFAFSNYSGYEYPDFGWLLWTKKDHHSTCPECDHSVSHITRARVSCCVEKLGSR